MLIGDNAGCTLVYLFFEETGDRLAGSFGFETALFSAMAKDFVAEHGDVAQLAGKPGFAIIQLPVYHDTHSNAMVEVDKQYVLLVFYATAAKLTIGHG